MKHFIRIHILIIFLISISLYYLYNSVNDAKIYLNQHLETMQLSQAKEYGEKIDKLILSRIKKDIYQELKSNKNLREEIESFISAQITSYYEYIYILYRDKHGIYRYLLDGSSDDKGIFDRKLNIDANSWDRVYETKKELIIHQHNLDKLWMTYLKPITIEDRVEAVLCIDFSTDFLNSISNSIEPLLKTLLYIFLFFLAMMMILIFQAILGHKNKKDSITDPLTKAFNRNYLKDFIHNSSMHDYQLMMIDIDYFKKINDTYGHKAGDFILKELANIVKNEIRYHDAFIRFGGEEFLLFIHTRSDESYIAYEIAERIRTVIANNIFVYNKQDIRLTISIGLNCDPQLFKNTDEAIKYADDMLYIAKDTGRNRIVFQT